MLREFLKKAMEKKNTVMFITSLVFITGIASYFNNCELILGAFLTFASIFLIMKNKLSYKMALFWIIIFYLGFFNAYFRIHNSDSLSVKSPSNAEITGRILSIPDTGKPDKAQFFFEVNSINNENIHGKTYVTVIKKDGDLSEFNIGNTYKLNGKLRTPFKASNPSQFDYGRYLRNFETFTTFYVSENDCQEIKSVLPIKWKFLQSLNNVRNDIIAVHSKYLKSPNLEILGGIVFGDDAVSPPDYIKASFVNSGLLHILAASGMNVAFIYGFWFWIMTLLKMPYKPRVLSGMAIVVLYTLMTGLGPSVIRAALMLLFVLAGKLIDRDSHSISLISFVAMLMLIYNPAFINDIGFQLSFLVTFGIICTANVLLERYKGNKVKEYISSAFLIPVVAQIWVAPLQMFYFNTFSTYSVFANVAIMPFLSVISFGGFVSSVLAIIKPIADHICFLTDFILNFLLTILVAISEFFSSLQYSLLVTTHPSIFQIILYYLIVLLATLMIKYGFNKRNLISLFLMIAVLLISTINFPNNKLEIITFDVGNADAFLIKTPSNKYFEIDTGKIGFSGGKPQSSLIMRKFMKNRGIKKLEGLIVTHFDSDHSGGAVDMIENLKIKNVYVNSYTSKSATSDNLIELLKSGKQNSMIAENNSVIYEEKDLIIKTFRINADSDNESSIITLLKYKDFEMLFMGDAGVYAFNQISSKLPNNVEVLKAGHHGAANSADKNMIIKLSPQTSILSTGINSYGHPNKVTLDVLKETEIFRTDKNNSIKISTDGSKYNVYTFDSGMHKYIFASEKYAK